jgi:hypothetical protein
VDRTRGDLAAHRRAVHADGTIITGWIGGIPEDQVLELPAQHDAG